MDVYVSECRREIAIEKEAEKSAADEVDDL